MTTSTLAPPGRPTLLDRVARWALDTGGDLYGDERERLRWYEGIAVAASLQWLAVPWAAAILVWILGRPAVLPLGVLMIVMYLPILVCTAYMRSRRVDTAVRRWSRKAVVLTVLSGLPYGVFVLGCALAYAEVDAALIGGMAVGAVLGGAAGGALMVVSTRRRRRREAAAEEDAD